MNQRAINRLQFLNEIIKALTIEAALDDIMSASLRRMLHFFSASQAFFFTLDDQAPHACFEEYAGSVSSSAERSIPHIADDFLRLRTLFPEDDCLCLNRSSASREALRFLDSRSLSGLLAAPFYVDGRLAGYAGVSDPARHSLDADMMCSLSFILSNELIKRTAIDKEHSNISARTERYRLALETANLSIWDYDFQTKRLIPSPPGRAPIIENAPDSLVESGYIHPDYVDAYLNIYRRLNAGEKYVEGVFRIRSDTHSEYWYEHVRYTSISDAAGKPFMAVGVAEDVTEKHAAQINYARELQLQQLLSSDMFATLLIDVTTWKLIRYQCRNPQFAQALKDAETDTIIRLAADSVVDDLNSKAYLEGVTQQNLFAMHAAQQDTLTLEFRRKMPDNQIRWTNEIARLLEEPDTGHLMLFVQIRDVDEERRRLDALARAAETDSMTGFLDHTAAMHHMQSYLEGEGRHGRHALFMIDVDNFKSVNDNLGHIRGDEVITRIAESISGLFRASDILGRVGGDEFLVLMKNIANPSLAVKKASELVDALQFVCASDTISVNLSASVGVSLYTAAHESLDMLYGDADAALYRAKNAGKNRYAFSSGDSQNAGLSDSAIPSDIVQLRTLLEYMDGGVVLGEVGEKLTISYVSPSLFTTLRRNAQEVGEHGEHLLKLVYDEDLPPLISALRDAVKNGTLLDTAFRVHIDGDQLGWRHLRAVQLPGSAGSVPRLIGVISDMTEIKRSTAQLEAIIENAPCGIGMFEYDGKKLVPLFVNNTALAMSGSATKEALIDRLCGDAFKGVSADDLPRATKAFKAGLSGSGAFEFTYRSGLNVSAGKHYVQVRGIRLREYETGEHPVVLLMYSDVTRETSLTHDLQLAEERYRIALTCADVMLWEVDIPARMLRQSSEVASRFAYGSQNIVNIPDGIIEQGNIAPESVSEVRRMYNDLLSGRDSEEYFSRSRFDDEYTWLKTRFKVLKNEKGEPYYAVGVSEPVPNIDAEMQRFKHERQISALLESSLLAACHVNLSKDRVEYFYLKGETVQGDNTPKTYTGLASVIAERAANADNAREYLALLASASLFARFRENQHLVFANLLRRCYDGSERWTHCAVHLLRHPVSGDLYGFFYLRDANDFYRLAAAQSRPLEYEPGTQLYTAATMEMLVKGYLNDSRALHSVCAMTVFELVGLDEARALRSTAIISDLLVTVGRLCRVMIGGNAFAGVLDDTHLMMFHMDASSADAHQNRLRMLRERIGQALRHTHPNDPIELMFGFATERLRVASYETLLRKARVACRSALRWADSSIARYAEPGRVDADLVGQLSSPHANVQRDTVLIVDDARSYRTMLRRLLETDYTVLVAANGAAALKLLRAHEEVAAIILDLYMPELDGFHVLEIMREDPAFVKAPVIVVTADDDPKNEARVLDLGAADVISKPFYGQTMLRRVRNIIARSDAARISEQNRAYELKFQQQANLLRLADYDDLTGVYNKRAFCLHLREKLNANPDVKFLLVRWDIDRFKVFNDSFGTQAGDTLLREIGAAMHEYAAGSIYGHLEADHFVLCMPASEADVDAFAATIEHFLSTYPLTFNFAPRFGVYRVDEPEIDVSLMCDRALLALRNIKGSYMSKIAYYDESLRKRLLDEQELISDMQAALEREEFVIYFQPQYNYDSGELIGAEALVRWQHPTRGMLMPGDFIPLFENNGFVSQLDRYVWDQSCRAMRRWLDEAGRLVPVSIAVNISRLDIYDPLLCTQLKALVDRYDLPPAFLKLEITESAYMSNPQQLIEVVTTLQDMGFTVEMDDFGSGYSSLNTLKDVPVDVLKLDIHFLSCEQSGSTRGGNILNSVIRMARWLQLPVIAEGVETREQADYLKSLGCTYMQGFFFSKPLPAAAFEQFLVSSRLGQTNMYRNVSLDGASAFWDASGQTALIFNDLVGGAAIMEYHDGQLEAVRINDSFFRVLGTTREAYSGMQTHVLDRFTPETKPHFTAMLERAITSGEDCNCETLSLPLADGGRPFWLQSHARLLAQSRDSFLFYVSIENITERKELEHKLQLRRYSDMLLDVYDEVFELDYAHQIVTVHASKCATSLHAGAVIPLAESIQRWCSRYVNAEDAPRLLALVSPETRHTGAVEYRFTRHDKEHRICATMLCLTENVYLLCNLDVTEYADLP